MTRTLLITAGVLSFSCGAAFAEGCRYGHGNTAAELTPQSSPLLAQAAEVEGPLDGFFRDHGDEVEGPAPILHN